MHAVVLKYLLEVARHGSIRKAAQTLFVASNTVNRQIQRLEEELGTEWFNRVPSGILIPSHRSLSHVTRQFLDRITRRLKQLQHAATL